MYKRSLRLLSLFLTVVMLFNMLPAAAWAAEADTGSVVSASAQTGSKPAEIVEELPGKRTEYSKEFRLSNGLHMAAIYNDPVHYEENGQWKDIDNTLKLSGGGYTNTAGVWNVSFPQQLSKNNAVTITKDGYTLSFFMTGQLRRSGDLEVMSGGVQEEAVNANMAETEPAIAETEPVIAETEPAIAETEPAIAETEPAIAETEPAIAETEPAIAETEPAIAETEPAIAETEPAIAETEPAIVETEPAVAETEAVSSEAEAVPAETIAEVSQMLPVSPGVETLAIGGEMFTVQGSQISTAQVQQLDLTAEKAAAEHPETVLEKNSSRLQYESVYTNTDVVYDLVSNQVKESIVIGAYDAALRGYRYTLSTGAMIPVLTESGDIHLYDEKQEKIVMVMPAPYLLDDAGEYCGDVTVNLSGANGTYTLTYTLPQSWMADKARQYPVVLDPVVSAEILQGNIRDIALYQYNIEANYQSGSVACGNYSTYGIIRTFIKYAELPALSNADVIVNASLRLCNFSNNGSETPIEAHKVTGQWDSASVTWESQPGYDPTVEDYAIIDGTGYYYWDITEIARAWYSSEDLNGDGIDNNNTGLMLRVPDSVENAENSRIRHKFYSSDYSIYQRNEKPTLTIYFRNNNGLESYWDYTASSAGRAGTGYINNYSGNLVWTRGDIGFGGNRMPVSISHIYNANDAANNPFGMGYGWRTNFNQRVYQWEEDSAYYVWEDADGTAHYFLYDSESGAYQDEDGLELTLTVGDGSYTITNKTGNTSCFDSNGRLISESNNQASKSSITVTYTTADGYLIDTVTDGVGRKYYFTYPDGLLNRISYKSDGTEELSYVTYGYTDSKLTSVTDKDGETSHYTYGANNLLLTAQDIDGYKLTYTYNQTEIGKPSRVASVEESDGSVLGGKLTFQYDHNQTTVTDVNGNIQILQFNNWGNTVSVQDGEGRAQFGQYANNDSTDTSSSAKGNQLKMSSKLQNTVGNLHKYTSFELDDRYQEENGYIIQATDADAYYGSKSTRVSSTQIGVIAATDDFMTIPAGETYTFSAYVKVLSGTASIGFYTGATTVRSETTTANQWERLEVSYTNTTDAAQFILPVLYQNGAGDAFIDCCQVEQAPTASRYNLIEDGDLRYSAYGWTAEDGFTLTTDTAAAPELEGTVYTVTGDPQSEKRAAQTVYVSGEAGDSFVLAGWAKGDAVPLSEYDSRAREFGMIATFHYTESTEETAAFTARFNPDVENWQYSSRPMVAAAAYDYITVELAYDYNANTVCFDGIQLYKEVFGSSYTYDEDGNVTSVVDLQKQTTTYEYDDNDNLTGVNLPNGAKLTYTYDDHHNVKTATTEEGLRYEFTYDAWGNNTSVSIVNGDSRITSSVGYSANGNFPVSATDALGKVTRYGYNADTNVLNWVQYPEDTEATRTVYTYDDMYRMATAELTIDPTSENESTLSVAHTYENDLLTKIQTASTAYNYDYGKFALTSSIMVGTTPLVSYKYSEDRNFYLEELAYGNGDSVQYEYDQQGRVTKQSYEDASYVTYDYDNSGALATVYDSETGISTTYYYDFTDRMMKYVESGNGYSHSVGYEYDTINNLTQMVETVNGVKRTTSYGYDKDNRVISITNDLTDNGTADGITESYTYDTHGRVATKVTKNGDATVLTESYEYVGDGTASLSGLVRKLTISSDSYSIVYEYTYDDNGNVISINDQTYEITYEYDAANQLIRENNQQAGSTYTWVYDNAGNIQSKNQYAYTTGTVGTASDTVNYSYDESQWRDLLTAYDGAAITYDQIGNPLSDGTRSYTWKQGRQLATLSDGTSTWTNTYNADGLRTSRTNGTSTYSYVYNGSQLVQMTVDGNTLYFTYDASGTPQTVTYNGTTYYYATNLQGDITAILDSTGTTVVSYTYDAWGNHTSGNNGTGTLASTLGRHNPLRYRGYVYDTETGLHYVSSRYYDPEIGRFINADSVLAGVGSSIQGYNMFAYCFNNPVNMVDYSGNWPQWIEDTWEAIKDFFSSDTNSTGGEFEDGIFRGSGSLTGGYSEVNGRLQVNSKDSKTNGMLGAFGKVSVGNASGKVGIGNDDASLSFKGVGDGLTASAQAGIQYKNGAGLAAKAKAAVLSGRVTAELDLFGWQIEFGVSGDLLSVGAEAMIGVFPNEGFTAKASVGAGLFGAGFVFRVKPAQ